MFDGGQTEAQTLTFLGAEKGIKNFSQQFLFYSRPIIFEAQADFTVVFLIKTNLVFAKVAL